MDAPLGARIAIETRWAATVSRPGLRAANGYRDHLRLLLARPGVAEDAIISSSLRLMIAEPFGRLPPPPDALPLLDQVAQDSRLTPQDPLRVGALVRVAALRAEKGDLPGAASAYARSGLTGQQCALLDAKPALIRTHVNGLDFPREAMRWGFEGWVRAEYDITAAGGTAAPRAIIAYPPFVFRDAAIEVVKKLSYTKSYRPDGSAGCGGQQEVVAFRL